MGRKYRVSEWDCIDYPGHTAATINAELDAKDAEIERLRGKAVAFDDFAAHIDRAQSLLSGASPGANILCAALDEIERLRAASVEDLRKAGWSVAVHNDYTLDGCSYTFWGITKGDRWLRGEGLSDAAALAALREKIGGE